MATHIASFGELTAMPMDELRKEVTAQRLLIRKMRLGVHLNKEKDTAKYRREKRALARMLTAVGHVEKHGMRKRPAQGEGLKKKPKTSTVSAPVQS